MYLALGSKNKQSGMSIIEVLVATSILGLSTYLAADLVGILTKQDSLIESFAQSGTIVAKISETLKDANSCQETFNVNAAPGTPVPNIKTLVGAMPTTVYSTGQVIPLGNIRIASIQISNFYQFGANRRGVIELNINLELLRDSTPVYTRSLPIFVEAIVDGGNNVVSCRLSGTGGVSEATCNSLGGTFVAGQCQTLNVTGNYASTNQITIDNTLTATNAPGLTSGSFNATILQAQNILANNGSYSGPVALSNNLTGNISIDVFTVRSAGSICVAGICRNFNNNMCAAGQYARGINADGSLNCAAVPPPPPPPPPPPWPLPP